MITFETTPIKAPPGHKRKPKIYEAPSPVAAVRKYLSEETQGLEPYREFTWVLETRLIRGWWSGPLDSPYSDEREAQEAYPGVYRFEIKQTISISQEIKPLKVPR